MMIVADCKVFLSIQPVDMRKSYEGLTALTQSVLQQDPFSGHLFVFTNKKRDRLKVLYWHLNGFCLWQKRLEKGQFHVPKPSSEASLSLTLYQLNGLFQGIEWGKITPPCSLSYHFV